MCGDGRCHDGRRFGAQDGWAQGDGEPTGGGVQRGTFRIHPSALRPDQQRYGGTIRGECVDQERRARLLFEAVTMVGGGAGGGVRQCRGQLFGVRDFGRSQPTALLAAFERDLAPAFHSFRGCRQQPVFAACGFHGYYARDADLGSFFDHPFKSVELE
jgi:hypothetical protein